MFGIDGITITGNDIRKNGLKEKNSKCRIVR